MADPSVTHGPKVPRARTARQRGEATVQGKGRSNVPRRGSIVIDRTERHLDFGYSGMWVASAFGHPRLRIGHLLWWTQPIRGRFLRAIPSQHQILSVN
jgi:hypothetical protein